MASSQARLVCGFGHSLSADGACSSVDCSYGPPLAALPDPLAELFTAECPRQQTTGESLVGSTVEASENLVLQKGVFKWWVGILGPPFLILAEGDEELMRATFAKFKLFVGKFQPGVIRKYGTYLTAAAAAAAVSTSAASSTPSVPSAAVPARPPSPQPIEEVEEDGGVDGAPLRRPGRLLSAAPPSTAGVSPPPKRKGSAPKRRLPLVDVFYGTNRKRCQMEKKATHRYFEGQRDEQLHHGLAQITVPSGHKAGEINKQSWKLFSDNESLSINHFSELEHSAFSELLRQSSGERSSHDVMLFVHGFNTSFQDGLRRTAQLAYDTEFAGTPVCFSWPSAVSVASYFDDQSAVDATVPVFVQFFEQVCQQLADSTARVHIIAHSMGNRLLTSSFQGISRFRDRIGNICCGAPDVGQATFVELASAFRQAILPESRMSVYTCPYDIALIASEFANREELPRFGQYPKLLAGVDVFVVTGLATQLDIHHGYLFNVHHIVRDLAALLARDVPILRAFYLFDCARE